MMDRTHTIALMAAALAAKDGVKRGPVNPMELELYARHAHDIYEAVEREAQKRLESMSRAAEAKNVGSPQGRTRSDYDPFADDRS